MNTTHFSLTPMLPRSRYSPGKYTMTRHFSRKGFILLEVMLCLAIFAIGALVCLESFLLNTRNARIVRDTQVAVLLAETQAGELLVSSPRDVPEQGTWKTPHQLYNWTLDYHDLVLSETEVFPAQLGWLTVTWSEGNISFAFPVLKKKTNENR